MCVYSGYIPGCTSSCVSQWRHSSSRRATRREGETGWRGAQLLCRTSCRRFQRSLIVAKTAYTLVVSYGPLYLCMALLIIILVPFGAHIMVLLTGERWVQREIEANDFWAWVPPEERQSKNKTVIFHFYCMLLAVVHIGKESVFGEV